MEINLLGKDYFTVDEAAHYACVSNSQFRKYCKDNGIYPVSWMGKMVYRKSDIQRAIELQWRKSQSGAALTSSTGAMKLAGTAKA